MVTELQSFAFAAGTSSQKFLCSSETPQLKKTPTSNFYPSFFSLGDFLNSFSFSVHDRCLSLSMYVCVYIWISHFLASFSLFFSSVYRIGHTLKKISEMMKHDGVSRRRIFDITSSIIPSVAMDTSDPFGYLLFFLCHYLWNGRVCLKGWSSRPISTFPFLDGANLLYGDEVQSRDSEVPSSFRSLDTKFQARRSVPPVVHSWISSQMNEFEASLYEERLGYFVAESVSFPSALSSVRLYVDLLKI